MCLLVTLGAGACGGGVRWTDAYAPSPSGDDRTLLANAMAESDPPVGFTPGARLHPEGTLARLQYETFDGDGHRLDQWEVRALVPPLPDRLEDRGCPAECQAEAARGAAIITASGSPGIAAEWVLRMPANRAFDLGSRAIVTEDLRHPTPRRVPVTFKRREGRDVPEPANIRVTLVDACSARVRIGRVTHLEFFPDTTVPIPRRFRTTRWLQVDGCGSLPELPSAPKAPPPAARAKVDEAKPDSRAVTLRRSTGTGMNALVVDESWFLRHPEPIEFAFAALCRYDSVADVWTRVPSPISNHTIRIAARTAGEPRGSERVVVQLPAQTGLFWLQWIERADGERSTRRESLRDALASSGPMLCNDVDLGSIPNGRVAACVPFADRAEARSVPLPREACTR